jgi:hypothetical protein
MKDKTNIQKKDMVRFLIKSTIPEKKKDDIVYNCVWRAHRDVLNGRFYFKKYLKQNENNQIVENLVEIIEFKKPLCSKPLIEELSKGFDVEFGAVQKLVNMTLKYLIIIDYFNYNGFSFDIDIQNCDCPLDSTILHEIERDDIKWTSITPEQYQEVQKVISDKKEVKNQGNIIFDFKKW